MPQPPLVIVSEHGKHDEAARRIVRAQAARASAPQSRMTRARNRGERESRSSAAPTLSAESSSVSDTSSATTTATAGPSPSITPLLRWLRAAFPRGVDPAVTSSVILPQQRPSSFEMALSTGTRDGRPRLLPLALPRGFAELIKHIQLDKHFLDLISQTACFDLASPGIEHRLQVVLSALMLYGRADDTTSTAATTTPVNEMMRLTCVCLLLSHGKTSTTSESFYQGGLVATWHEVGLTAPVLQCSQDTARALCWAAVIISVTAGAACSDNGNTFKNIIRQALRILNVQTWEGIRAILLDFIYPCSTLEPYCAQLLQTILLT